MDKLDEAIDMKFTLYREIKDERKIMSFYKIKNDIKNIEEY
jgi:hypothetical protein